LNISKKCWKKKKVDYKNIRPVRLAYQPPTSSTFLSEQISTSHQPPAKRTG
jgi:hypothetical protein